MDISHEVFNQLEPMVNDSLHKSRWPLQDALKFNAPSLNIAALTQPSTQVGLAEMPAHACDQVLDVHVR